MLRAVKVVLRNFGWLSGVAGLYGALVGLEYDWNLFGWGPKLDLVGTLLLLVIAGMLAAIGFLAGASSGRFTRAFSFLLCLACVVLGFYLLPAEREGSGFFAREAPSPVWYRVGRSVVLALPMALWCVSLKPRGDNRGI